ncbi:hypothetical protein [uncultured Clostridium sp.]|uniref:hypothetical protein n=1 Tax=uncultured Clostridium sp. TaxID=59620 RepID=UPI003457E831
MNSYEDYINNIINQLKKELIGTFSIRYIDSTDSLKRIFEKSQKKFIFIFDEWDYIFNNNLFEKSSKG